MKIAYVSFEYPTETGFGGIATYVHQAAQLLANRGHQVEVFTATQQNRSQQQEGNVLVNYVQAKAKEFPTAVQSLFAPRHQECAFDVVEGPDYGADAHIIQKLHPQIAHVARLHAPRRLLHSVDRCPPQFSGWLRHKLIAARQTLESLSRGTLPTDILSYHPDHLRVSDLEEVERDYTQKSNLVVSASRSLSEWAIREWSVSPSKSLVIPNPYFPSQDILQIDTEEPGKTVGYFGRLQYVKGVDDLVSAIPHILKSEPTTRFRFVGRATIHPATLQSYDKHIRNKLRKCRHAIELVGSQPLATMAKHYAAVDICVVPSLWDNFPYVVQEAMASGRPIVATNVGGIGEMLHNGKHGLLVAPHQPEMIADAVIQLVRDPELRKMLATAARQRVLEEYSYEKVASQLENGYRTAIELARVTP